MIIKRTQTFQKENIVDKLNKISFFVFCTIAIDCSITGGGHWLMAGPFSFRMILGILAVAAAAPAIIRNINQWVKDPMLISLLLFVAYIAFCAFRGVKSGNQLNLLLSDLKGFAWLFLIPVAAAVIDKPERLILLMGCLAVTAIVQALMILVLNALFIADSSLYDIFYPNGMAVQWATVDHISATTYRFFFNSAPYLVVGILCMIYLQLRALRFNVVYVVGMGICLTALMLTFTRSIYGAAVISLALALIIIFFYCAHRKRRLAGQVIVAIAVFALLVIFQQIVLGCNSAQFAMARTFNINIENNDGHPIEVLPQEECGDTQQIEALPQEECDDTQQIEALPREEVSQHHYLRDTRESDNIREVTLKELQEMIGKNPVFGNGLGAAISYREGGHVEYFYQDIVNKTGFFGLLLYYFPIGYMVFVIVFKGKSDDPDRKMLKIIWFSGLCVFLVATYFNPYMNSSLGICCYSIAIACFHIKSQPANKDI